MTGDECFLTSLVNAAGDNCEVFLIRLVSGVYPGAFVVVAAF